MAELGLVAGTWGNVSARVSGSEAILITPSGLPYDQLDSGSLVKIDMKGALISGSRPSSELPLHLAIYAARPDVNAIVHTHSIHATACAVARCAIPPALEELIQVNGGVVEVSTYALPGSKELAKNAVLALADRSAALLANHGAVSCGQTLRDALLVAQLVEKAAQVHILAQSMGGATVLSDDDVNIMRRFYLEHYRR
jgi:L-fuculose-phosphate aldolase